MTDLLLRSVELDGRLVDVAIAGGRITAVGRTLSTEGAEVLDGEGGAVLPGLHDHHLHLLATAAADRSVVVGPPAVRDAAGLAAALSGADRALAPGAWLRAVAYHEVVAGDLDRHGLDRLVTARPVRVQHRTGARWTLNTAAVEALELDRRDHPGIERDGSGRPTGRLHRADGWLRDVLPHAVPDLAPLGVRLAAFGITGVTDTTPFRAAADLEALAAAALPQRIVVTGGPGLAGAPVPGPLERGPVKLVVDDGAYPALAELAHDMAVAHEHGRPVAVHCVTRAALVLALAAWDDAGSAPGDRVEHGAVIPPELFGALLRHGLTVVTQPGFVAERGDEYRRDVDPDDLPHLYRCRSLLDVGIPVAGSSDAPYSAPDPWAAMGAAVHRTTPSGAVLGPDEAVAPAQALALFLGSADAPGGPPRRVAVGQPADLCLLDRPLQDVLTRLTADDVVATIVAGKVVHP